MDNNPFPVTRLLTDDQDDENWVKAQSILKELTNSCISIIDIQGSHTGYENYPAFCRWLHDHPVGKERCMDCHLTNAFHELCQVGKSRIFSCHLGLTHFAIRLLPNVAVLSSPIVLDDLDLNQYIQFAMDVPIDFGRGSALLEEISPQAQLNIEQLKLTVELVSSMLGPLRDKLSKLVGDSQEDGSDSLMSFKVATGTGATVRRRRMREDRRSVITGIGVVSPIGIGNENFVDGILKGKNGVRRITSFDPIHLPSQMAGEVLDFDPLKYMDAKTVSHTARASQFAIAGTKMALDDAQLVIEEEEQNRIAAVIGAGTNGMEYAAEQCNYFYENQGKKPVNPYTGVVVFAGACSGEISMKFGLKGPSHTVSTGCASTNDAIGYSARFIRSGEVDMVITGGTDAAVIPITISAFSSMRALSRRNDSPEEASRPFDKERDGFVLGEGAAIFIMEELNHALRRGARIYAEVLGYGATDDAYHMTKPNPDGIQAARAISIGLLEAGLSPPDIDYINAHGSSTPLNDKTETRIARLVFNRHVYSDKFAISSTKSMTGHALGSASAIGLAASLLGMERGFLPPTINYKVFDPECDLNYVPNEPQFRPMEFFLSNAFAFGGKNSCLILGKCLEGDY